MGLQVLGTFSVGQRSFMVGGVYVKMGSELDGMQMADHVDADARHRHHQARHARRLHPRRDTKLTAGDTAYLVGPYRELLDTLRKGQGAQQPVTSLIHDDRLTPAPVGSATAANRPYGVSSASRITLPPFSLTSATVLSTSSLPRKKYQFDGAPSGRSFAPSMMPRSAWPSKFAVLYRNSSESETCRSANRTPGGRSPAPWRSRWWSAGGRPNLSRRADAKVPFSRRFSRTLLRLLALGGDPEHP